MITMAGSRPATAVAVDGERIRAVGGDAEISALIDVERYQQFASEGTHFETEYFLTLTYQPPRVREPP